MQAPDIQIWHIDKLVLYARNPRKNDAAVDEAQTVTTRFNDQIKAFKAAHTN